jgi:hypothetical protein
MIEMHTRFPRILLVVALLIFLGLACVSLSDNGGEPSRTTTELYKGVTYIKEVRTQPRRMVVHIVKINVSRGTIQPIVTPPDNPKSDKPYNARTTSDFASQQKVQLAINGGGFEPWYDYKISYFPHSGDSVTPYGTVVVDDFVLNAGRDDAYPMVLFGGNRPVDIGYVSDKASYALAGLRILLDNGEIVSGLNDFETAPRTGIGNSPNGQTAIIVVIDGRQPGYSRGATLQELAEILKENGADNAIDLDGGGSSTLVINGNVMNSPVHQGIPGRERPVATHIGFKIK